MQPASKPRALNWFIGITGVVVIFLIGRIFVSFYLPAILANLAARAIVANYNYSEADRLGDGQAVLDGSVQYAATNQSVPQTTQINATATTLYLCAKSCSAQPRVSVPLSSYGTGHPNAAIKQYSATLTIPNANTIFIVFGAACNAANTRLGEQLPQTVSVLVGVPSSSGFQQRCIAHDY